MPSYKRKKVVGSQYPFGYQAAYSMSWHSTPPNPHQNPTKPRKPALLNSIDMIIPTQYMITKLDSTKRAAVSTFWDLFGLLFILKNFERKLCKGLCFCYGFCFLTSLRTCNTVFTFIIDACKISVITSSCLINVMSHWFFSRNTTI